jgi:biotin carboxyl carrier protein
MKKSEEKTVGTEIKMPFSGMVKFVTSGIIVAGAVVAKLESMKMEMLIPAPMAGLFVAVAVGGVFYEAGQVIGHFLSQEEDAQVALSGESESGGGSASAMDG